MLWIIIVICLFLIIVIIGFIAFRKATYPRYASAEGIEDNAVVEAYDRISRWPQFKLIRLIILNKLKKYHPEGSVADIGCGPGYLIAAMGKSLPHLSIIGIDISEEILDKARRNLAAKGLNEKVTFRLGDIQKLPVEPDSLDFAVSTLSLHHWSRPGEAIEELFRVLKPGGQFLIFDVRRDSPRLMYWIMRFAQAVVLPTALSRANEPTSSFLAGYTPAEVDSILSSTPFKKYTIDPGLFWTFTWGQKE